MPERITSSEPSNPESPPILGSWRNVYLTVLLHLAAWILLLYWFTIRYRPVGP